MKKIISVLLVLALMLSFAACANTNDDGDDVDNDSESSAETTESIKLESNPETKPDRGEIIYVDPLTANEKHDIEHCWSEEMEGELSWFDKDAKELSYEAARYYGEFSGYHVFFYHVGWEFEYKVVVELSGYKLVHDELFEIYAYKDGKLYNAEALCQLENIPKHEAYAISVIHESFENYIKTNIAK